MPEAQQLIYDWNTVEAPDRPSRPVAIHDETLRDGIQGPSVRDPDIDHKLHFLHLADELGVASIDLGLPGSGPRAMADVERLAAEIRDQRLHIKPLCAARTLEVDIRPVVEISQRVGIPIEVAAFIGSSPIRQYAEGWTSEEMVDNTRNAVRIHGCALGLGERVGNTHLDLLLVNFRLLGWIDTDLSKLREMGEVIAEGTGMPIPANYPVLGRDAFRTATGVHAAAVIKAKRKGDNWLANRVYSGVPAELFGCEQVIEIGPMSGESNVVFWLEQRGIAPHPELVRAVIDAAKRSDGLLSEAKVLHIIEQASPRTAHA